MLFAHDTEHALAAATDLANADLADLPALDTFLDAHRYTGARAGDAAELEAVRAVAGRVRGLWHLALPDLVEALNTMLRDAAALPQLVAHDGWDHHLHATPPDAPLADRITVETAMALVDVVRSGELDRLHVCAADDCEGVLVDLSRNRSRRYCSTACANRVNVAAFRARKRG